MNLLYLAIIGALATIAVWLLGRLTRMKADLIAARADANDTDRERLQLHTRLAGLLALDDVEEVEGYVSAVERVRSDQWTLEIPYGKWKAFTAAGAGAPKMRAFWPKISAQIFGVRREPGDAFVEHHHDAAETLVAVSGPLRVVVNGADPVHLAPGQSIYIPSGARHAVLPETRRTAFLCVWTQPPSP